MEQPRREAASYLRAYGTKCMVSGCLTFLLGTYSVFIMTDARELAMIFAIYFAYDSITDGCLDFIWRPQRRSLEMVLIAHHVFGVASMYVTPNHPSCLLCWRLITVAEYSTPLLYWSNYYRFVRYEEAPWWLSGAMCVAWPVLRLLSPMVAGVVQMQSYLSGSTETCGAHNLPLTVAYFAMNAHFFSLIYKRHRRNYGTASKQK